MKTQSETPKIPEQLSVVSLADGKPSQGLLIMLSLEMSKKNSFNIVFGPSDKDGKIQISKKEIEREVERNIGAFPMDYEDLSRFQGTMTVCAMTLDQVNSAIAAYNTYREATGYSSEYRDKLEAARSTLSRLTPKRLDVKVIEGP